MSGIINLTIVATVSLLFMTGTATAVRNDTLQDLYSGSIAFDVYREGEKIGRHHVAFAETKTGTRVDTLVELEVRVLIFTAFKYRYFSSAEWDSEGLESIEVTVDDDGKHFSMEALRLNGALNIRTKKDRYSVPAPIFPTNHWNAGVLTQSRVLNTLTGHVNDVRITPQGREFVGTEGGDVEATRYAYTGDLETETWYDDAGRWVKMRFRGRDGSDIEYICRRCQGGEMTKSKL